MKGAVHLLEDGDRADIEEETSPSPASPVKEGDRTSDTRRRQLHAMVEQLRPEDTMKLVTSCVCVHVANQISKTCHAESKLVPSTCIIMSQVKVITC